jgi:hypothetical protein
MDSKLGRGGRAGVFKVNEIISDLHLPSNRGGNQGAGTYAGSNER